MTKIVWKSFFVSVMLLGETLVAEEYLGQLEENATWFDRFHDYLSKKVVGWSDRLDTSLEEMIVEEDNQTDSSVKREKKRVALEKERQESDTFFQTKKYLDETTSTYVRVRLDSMFNSLDENRFNIRFRAHLPLHRTRKQFHLYMQDFTEKNTANLLQGEEDDETNPEVGMSYFAPKYWGVDSKYSLGLRGIHPFARARFNAVFHSGEWIVEPVETLEYSTKDQFSEETDLYLDTEPQRNTLFRIQLNRGTVSEERGMHYGIGFSYDWLLSSSVGMRVYQTFDGHTDYRYTPEGEEDEAEERFSGIYNYQTAVSYRRSVWRRWFFVEVIPSINFHRRFDFRPNYAIRVYLDTFFGNY